MQLDLFDQATSEIPRIFARTSGVEEGERDTQGAARGHLRSMRAGAGIAGLLLACASLLGQGERCIVDARFASPGSTIATYWLALRDGDADAAWDCFTDGRSDLPVPGQLWFLPPTRRLEISGMHTTPVNGDRVMVTYEVRYVPSGLSELRSFRTGDELVRAHGEWRIERPLGEASMPDWQPTPQRVDS